MTSLIGKITEILDAMEDILPILPDEITERFEGPSFSTA